MTSRFTGTRTLDPQARHVRSFAGAMIMSATTGRGGASLPVAKASACGLARGGKSPSELSPNLRKNTSVVTRKAGRPRPPKRASSAISLRASKVSMTPVLSVPRIWVISVRATGCS